MKLEYKALGQTRRQRVRTVARREFLNDPKVDKTRLRAALRQEFGFIEMILIGILVKLAVELILYWLRNRSTSPGHAYEAGEPGYE